ncbi:MAG TPA: TMEM175 family protein [Steroidobacteraceae bacterium]|jgi:uncharacterized membrane protein
MREHKIPADRLGALSDAVIAVLITIMVLELRAPQSSRFSALLDLWPTAISYAVSFVFIAIIWVNHHYLLRFVEHVTPRLIWVNFAHLFGVSLVPFATAWIARAQVAAAPVAVYAAIFAGVNLAYRMFEKEVLAQATASQLGQRTRRMARRRSLATLLIFVTASLVSLEVPLLGLALICSALVLYLRPEPPGSLMHIPRMS